MVNFLWLLPLVFLALWQYPQIEIWPETWLDLVTYAPYAIAGLGILIAFWLNRLQPILILLTIVLLNVGVDYFFDSNPLGFTAQILFPVFSILLPLNLVMWLLFPERGVHNKIYVISLVNLFLVQILFLFWYIENVPYNLVEILSQKVVFQGHILDLLIIPLVASILAWLFLVIKNAVSVQVKALDTTVIFVLLLMVIGLNDFETSGALAWMSAISALMIVLSAIFGSYQAANDPAKAKVAAKAKRIKQ